MRTVHLETSLPGVFAAGDVRYGSVKRVASAVGEEANAVELLHRYLAEPVPFEQGSRILCHGTKLRKSE